ncbi:recombinase family protein [Microbacterium sp. NPDC057407]|uniref:recombinase family protein n=1 Tax=Microbacterium sp. NPDC057407 TaxID=3346120 RepID=UPI00366AF5F0
MTRSATSPRSPRRTAVLYLRLSDARDEASTSIVRQRADLTAEAKRRDLVIVGEEVDNGFSGRKDRANASEALRMLRDGEAEVLLVWKFDRWSRQGISAVARLIETLDAAPRTQFVALQDGLNSDQPAWRIIASVLAEVARMESENTRLRVSSFVRHAKEEGRWPGGRLPVGYRSVPHPSGAGRVLEPDPLAAELLTEAARRLAGGESLWAAAKMLNATNLKPSASQFWTVQTLKNAFTGTAIVGRVSVQVPSADTTKRVFDVLRDENGDPKQFWEPVIPLDLWQAVRTVLRSKVPLTSAPAVAHPTERRLLANLLTCGYCGRPFYVTSSFGTPSYMCSSRNRGVPCVPQDGGTGAPSIHAVRFEAWVAKMFLRVAGHVSLGRSIVVEVPAVKLTDARASLAAVSARLGVANIDEEEAERLSRQQRDLRQRIRHLEANAPSTRVKLVDAGETLRSAWEEAETSKERRRQLLRRAIDHIAVRRGIPGGRRFDPARFDIVWQPDVAQQLVLDDTGREPFEFVNIPDTRVQPEQVSGALRAARESGLMNRFDRRVWTDYVTAAMRDAPLMVDIDRRRNLCLELAEHRVKHTAIGEIVGASKRTVTRDLKCARESRQPGPTEPHVSVERWPLH